MISAQEAAAKWGVHIRMVQRYYLDGRIPGAQKYGNNWLIPATAEKPGDGRRSGPSTSSSLAAELLALIEAASRPLPVAQPEGASIREPRLRRQVQAELAYLRGDFKQTMGCFTAAGRDEVARIYVAPMAIAAAISMGDYPFYSTIDAYLKGVIAAHPGTVMATYGELALPHGFISPFAESLTAFGGLLEQCLTVAYPDYYEAVIGQWQGTWRNWISFHNQFTKNNITDILTLREFHIATLVARRVPYTKIAAEHGISVGRLKNIITEIYGKLLVSNRAELAQYVF